MWTHRNSPKNSLGQNTGVGSLSLLQGIFPTQGSNPGLPHFGQILYQMSHKGSPRMLEWVAYSFSRRSSRPRNQTGISYIASGFFTNWAIREAHCSKCCSFYGFGQMSLYIMIYIHHYILRVFSLPPNSSALCLFISLPLMLHP